MQGYPEIVVTHYGLAGITVDPPNGCRLCHVNETGGRPMSTFGALLQTFGATTSSATVDGALSALDSQYPTVGGEIRAGIDPNAPPMVTGDAGPMTSAAVLPNVPQPSYGCQCRAGIGGGGGLPLGLALIVTLSFSFRRRGAPIRRR